MAVFERLIDDTKSIVTKWESFGQLKKVTIIRDVLGKIALVLEANRSITGTEQENLDIELRNQLGLSYRGHIYINWRV